MGSRVNFVGDVSCQFDNIVSRMAFVSKEYNDDPYNHRFNTIQGAIDWAYGEYGVVTDFANTVAIKVAPGIYEEQIHSYSGYYIAGMADGWDTASGRPPVTLYNTGADAAHYPLRSNDGDVAQMIGINLQTDASGIVGKVQAGFFTNCYFKNCNFIEATAAASMSCRYKGCAFYSNTYGGFNLTGAALASYGWITCIDCYVEGAPTFSSTHTGDSTLYMEGCKIRGHYVVGGDWEFQTGGSGANTHQEAVRNTIGTTSDVRISGGQCVNGIHFTSAPNSLKLKSLSFIGVEDNQIPAGEADITSAVTIASVEARNVVIYNGIAGEIQITDAVKYIDGSANNGYLSLQDAIDSIVTSGRIVLNTNLSALAELTIPNNTEIHIDGKGVYSMAFTADIVELGLGEKLHLSNIELITGGSVEINGNNSEFHMHCCIGANTLEILATAGTTSEVHLRNANITGATGKSAIQANNINTMYRLTNSRLTGATGQPAIEYTVDADSTLQAKFSTLIHGDAAGNAPIINTDSGDISYAMYSCALNATIPAADFTNTIGSPNITTDPQISF